MFTGRPSARGLWAFRSMAIQTGTALQPMTGPALSTPFGEHGDLIQTSGQEINEMVLDNPVTFFEIPADARCK